MEGEHNDNLMSQAAWFGREEPRQRSIPFSSRLITLIPLMLFEDLGIARIHFQYSSPHSCQGHGRSSHRLQSLAAF